MNPTTKKFPRTTLEAWPNRHPYCVEHYRKLGSIGWEIAGVLVALCCVIAATVMLAIWLSA